MTNLPSPEDLIADLQGKLNVWYWNAVVWERVHWFFGILGITFSALSAASNILPHWAAGFAVAATICLGVLGFASPQRRSDRYLRSYRILDTALREYKYNLRTVDTILQEHRRAEDMLTDASGAEVK